MVYSNYTSHYDVTYFQGKGLDTHMCKHGRNDKNSFKITCLENNCALYDCWKQLILRNTSSSEPSKLRCCYKNVKVGILHFLCLRLCLYFLEIVSVLVFSWEWLSGRVLDSRTRGRGFEPHRRRPLRCGP